ncbi:uncharacterized protein LAESUDRAFT_755612 [Laetiporus sulphureus 93-53]|uniref:G-protein coupled receptors family 2 profile 2 domain-containing protein n=1 Tax=Laetiporus sulphureus 93-53 TaxID=1314785 RepID=A0A165GY34_9APHY|nr:uncharacterized protein LAESUDRAFT_755612 [Laetiporus sulphureus 93-53]KZT10984.1 hypothetical protein LAESUDRAFT_755612 [Laetiporus sulphureus 93-53]
MSGIAIVQAIPGGNDYLLEDVDYTSGDTRGVVVSVVVSWFSGAAVVGLLVALAISAWNTRKSVNPHLFVRSHVAAYFVSLLLCDLLQAFGSILNMRWVANGEIIAGHYCTFQGFIKQSADVSTAIWSFLIALHTFLVVFLRWNMPRRSLYAMFFGGWGFVLLIIIIGPASYRKEWGPFYGIAGYWCWISSNYDTDRLVLDYLWLFVSAALTFILYILVYLNLRGNVTTSGIVLHRDSMVVRTVHTQVVALAKQMLIYPVAYTILILPITICRFVEWSGYGVSESVSAFADSVFLMQGLVDVILFLVTRRVLPDHSVLPRSVSIKFWCRKTGSSAVVTNASRGFVIDPDLEKGNADNSEEEKRDGIFKRADSPDANSELSHDHSVTIRVQSMVVDRIYMQPGVYEHPRTPPRMTPQTAGQMEDVSLDSAKAVRASNRDSDYYAKDLPPLPNSAYTPRGTVRSYYAENPAPTHSPRPNMECGEMSRASSPTLSPQADRYVQDTSHAGSPLRSARSPRNYGTVSPAPAYTPRRTMTEDARPDNYYAEHSPSHTPPHTAHSDGSERYSATESSHYTSDEEDHHDPVHSPMFIPRTAPRPLYLGTPRSATFPTTRPPQGSARTANFPLSARLPPSGGNWF